MRGVGQTDPNFALEPGVGMYIDDVYLPTLIGSLLDLSDVERVEVLRGPQGTLSGRNSLGGSVNIFTTRPKGDNSGSLEGTYGS
uniref:TonB-dependent receptor plug domain-containing protein n=1 Tax=Streptomyces turgidiscabies TaxID=85558 RepID=UPI0038F6EDDC